MRKDFLLIFKNKNKKEEIDILLSYFMQMRMFDFLQIKP